MKRYGTRCTVGGHQNIRMGNCGYDQDASKVGKIRSHSLCNFFYNAAFHYPFYAVRAPDECKAKNAASVPPNYRLGYLETRNRSET